METYHSTQVWGSAYRQPGIMSWMKIFFFSVYEINDHLQNIYQERLDHLKLAPAHLKLSPSRKRTYYLSTA